VTRRRRSLLTYVGSGALIAAGIAVSAAVVSLTEGGVEVAGGIVLVVGAPILAVVASIGLFLSDGPFRLVVIAMSLTGLGVASLIAPVALFFLSAPAYLLAGVLVWLLITLMIAALAVAWRESRLSPAMALLMLAVGALSALVFAAYAIVAGLAIHPVYS